RDRADGRRPALGLPPPSPDGADARRRRARLARRRARDRAGRERRTPVDLAWARRLPALRARKARARRLGGGLSRTAAGAREPARARPPDRRARRPLLAAAAARARPRDGDRPPADARRHA